MHAKHAAARELLVGSASTVSGLCPFAGQAEYVSPAQCGAYAAQTQINRRSVAISSASHAEGRWFDPSRDHQVFTGPSLALNCQNELMVSTPRQRVVNFVQRRFANLLMRSVPTQTLLETAGRKSGQRRSTPIGGRLDGDRFWLVSEFGERSQYVRNIKANPLVRVRVRGRCYRGTAHLMPDDDAKARLEMLPRINSAAVRAMGETC